MLQSSLYSFLQPNEPRIQAKSPRTKMDEGDFMVGCWLPNLRGKGEGGGGFEKKMEARVFNFRLKGFLSVLNEIFKCLRWI